MSQTFNLQPHGIQRPEKIRWRFPYNGGEVVEQLQSKKLKSFLRDIDSVLQAQSVTVTQKPLSETEFAEWLPYYHSKMTELGYDQLASVEWYRERTADNKTVEGIFFHQHGKLIGSAIVLVSGQDKATLAFKASDRLDLTNKPNSSLGAVVDYWFLKHMAERGFTTISGGKSRNAFGVINSLGYVDYKMKFGYQPSFPQSADLVSEVPLNEDGIVLFFGLSSTQPFAMFAVKPSGSTQSFEPARFATPEMPFIELEY